MENKKMTANSVGELKAVYVPTGVQYEGGKLNSARLVADAARKVIGTDINYREHFIAMMLNNNNELIGHVVVSVGGLDRAAVDIRLLFQHALLFNAHRMVLVHNHPNGALRPSEQDISITKAIKQVCTLLKIDLLDHLILTKSGVASMLELKLL